MGQEIQTGAHEVRVAFLGAGVIADAHARALRRIPGLQLAAVCDVSASKATSFQRRYGVPECYTSIEQMRRASIDVVHILLPPAAHANAAIECLGNGWDVFLEKPLGVSAGECDRIAAAAGGRRVGVNHNYTFNPAYRRLIREIQERRFGRIEHAIVCLNMPLRQLSAGQHGNWIFAHPGNIVLELGPHALGSITRLFGEPRSAQALVSGETILQTGVPFYDTWQMSLICERGTAQCLLSTGKEFLDMWVYVVGQDGAAWVDMMRGTYRSSGKSRFLRPVDDLLDAMKAGKSYLGGGISRFAEYAGGFMGLRPAADLFGVTMLASIRAFYEARRTGTQPPIGLKEGATAIRACEMAIAAGLGARAGATVEQYVSAQ